MSKERINPVSDIDEYFEKEGFADIVQKFFETEQFKEAVSRHYAKLKAKVEEMHADLPGHLLTEAVRLWKEAEYTKETFESNIIVNVKMRLHITIISFKSYLKDILPHEELKRAFTDDNYSALMRDVNEIAITLVEEVVKAHCSQIVPQYIPEEVIEEIIDLITTNRSGGGAIVFLNVPKEEDDSGITH